MKVRLLGLVVVAAILIGGLGAFAVLRDGGAAGAGQVLPTAAGDELVLRPPIGQSRDGARELTPGVVTFRPARKGAEVLLQRDDGSGWQTVETGVQDADGRFAFRVPVAVGKAPRYRASTVRDGAEVVTAAVSRSPWTSSFGDEFDGTELKDHWSALPVGAGGRTCADGSPDTVEVGGGVARVKVLAHPDPDRALAQECEHGQFLNAQYGTHESRLFTHGIFAARLRTQVPEGMHSAFWLYPYGPKPVDVPPDDLAGHHGAEIDIMEYFGDSYGSGTKRGLTWSYVYRPEPGEDGKLVNVKDGGVQRIGELLDPGTRPSDEFHVYSVEWTPEHYIFRFDGVETMRVEKGISRHPSMLLLSMLTSDWEIPRLDEGSLPASMDVDWVRVWQR